MFSLECVRRGDEYPWRLPPGRLQVQAAQTLTVIAGGVLWLAAVLKAYELSTTPVSESGLLSSRWFLILLVEFELVLGGWLLFGPWVRLAWCAATFVFVLFGFVSLSTGLRGAESCGCLGPVKMSPWLMLCIDVLLVAALVALRPNEWRSRHIPIRLVALVALPLVLGLPLGYVMAAYTPTVVASDGVILGSGNTVVLEPDEWQGKQFPLLGHIDKGKMLAQGSWDVWLYRHNCPECRQLLTTLPRRNEAPLALVELPPHVEDTRELVDAGVTQMQVTDRYKWIVKTPVELHLVDGRVQEVR